MLVSHVAWIMLNLNSDYSHYSENLYIHGVFQACNCKQRKKKKKPETKGKDIQWPDMAPSIHFPK